MPSFLTDAQLRAELQRCHSCEAKPCRSGCPAGCSPADFIMAARCGEPSDYRRAAAHILAHNPLGGVCGSVCPDSLCMSRCSRRSLDAPVNIPAVQAALVQKARKLGVLPRFEPPPATGQRVAVVGAGPAGLGAASVLGKAGHTVHVFDRVRQPGGMARLIPRDRLDPEVLAGDIGWLLGVGDVHLVLGRPVPLPRDLLARGFAAVIVAAGLDEPVELDVPGRQHALDWTEVLGGRPPPLRGKRIAVIGDGGVAVDCAHAALAQGAAHVELFALRKLSELELTRRERDRLFASGVHLSCRLRVTAIRGRGTRVTGLVLRKVELADGQPFHPSRVTDLRHGEHERRDLDTVILAIGGRPGLRLERHPRIVYAGDLETGPTSVVEALASGKKAGLAVHRMLAGDDLATCPDRGSCPDGTGCPKRATCPEWNRQAPRGGASSTVRVSAGLPVPLTADFFGRPIASPFLLAGPHAQGYAQLRKAYEAGWAGGIIDAADTADDLDRVCRDVERLVREFPDRLTMVAASGPVTGEDRADADAWEATTRKLEAAGAMAVEYSVHFRPRGDSAGDLASHDPELAARLVDRVLAARDPGVPRFVRLEASVVSHLSLARIAAVLARRPYPRAGVTLAVESPGVPEVVVGSAARQGLFVTASSPAQDYLAAASLLALGARAVQLGAAVARYGTGVVSELHGGLSYHLAERGMRSVAELVGSALARATPAADELSGKHVCELDPALCTRCGNCTRCPNLALALDARGIAAVDPSRCTGCGLCVEQCFVGAIAMRRVSVRD